MKPIFSFSLLVIFLFLQLGCSVQSIPKAKNQVDASLAEITNQYKRRSDLIPNLVKTVKGYAAHEKETLQAVIEARSKATSTKIDASNISASQIKAFQSAQSGLSSALSKLMVVVEKYPNLKANENFLALQSQLEGTENRITVARQRYIESIKGFNNQVTVPPYSWTNAIFYNHEKMPQWDVGSSELEQIKKAPTVDL